MQDIIYKPIGIIRTQFKESNGTPIQPAGARGSEGKVQVFPKYTKGLVDLDGFSHIILIYHFHLAQKGKTSVRPYMDEQTHGVFATRSPARPNKIGISVVELIKVKGEILHVKDVDIIDNTPVLDIKPYVKEFDEPGRTVKGWLGQRIHRLQSARADGRFSNDKKRG